VTGGSALNLLRPGQEVFCLPGNPSPWEHS
jgi:hypothetical protein